MSSDFQILMGSCQWAYAKGRELLHKAYRRGGELTKQDRRRITEMRGRLGVAKRDLTRLKEQNQ